MGLSSWHCDLFYLRIAPYADGSSPMKEQHLGVVGGRRGRGRTRQSWYTYHLSSFTCYPAQPILPVERVPDVSTESRASGWVPLLRTLCPLHPLDACHSHNTPSVKSCFPMHSSNSAHGFRYEHSDPATQHHPVYPRSPLSSYHRALACAVATALSTCPLHALSWLSLTHPSVYLRDGFSVGSCF